MLTVQPRRLIVDLDEEEEEQEDRLCFERQLAALVYQFQFQIFFPTARRLASGVVVVHVAQQGFPSLSNSVFPGID